MEELRFCFLNLSRVLEARALMFNGHEKKISGKFRKNKCGYAVGSSSLEITVTTNKPNYHNCSRIRSVDYFSYEFFEIISFYLKQNMEGNS